MSKILYYIFLKPLSLLPLGVLYFLSDFIYYIIFHLLGYRKKVVFTNLRNSFPEKSEKEIQKIGKQFYSHLCDLIVESVRLFSISKEEVLKRCVYVNPEIPDAYAKKGQNVVIITGHYNNWEMASVAIAEQLMHLPVGLIAPIKNKFLYNKMKKSRAQYGTGLVEMKKIKGYLEENKNKLVNDKIVSPVFIADQAPSNNKGKYLWTNFLNQDTPVMLGAEKYARMYNWPVIFGEIKKVKRGYYEVEFSLLEENPQSTEELDITERHTRLLEKIIQKNPPYWLWSHKRWKRQRPTKENK